MNCVRAWFAANVESLAAALVKIIEIRAKQSNFQLIVITHDEEFLALVARNEYADYYYRITKQDGFSHVERKDISSL